MMSAMKMRVYWLLSNRWRSLADKENYQMYQTMCGYSCSSLFMREGYLLAEMHDNPVIRMMKASIEKFILFIIYSKSSKSIQKHHFQLSSLYQQTKLALFQQTSLDNLIMQNKTGPKQEIIDRTKACSLQKVYDSTIDNKNNNSRIFQVPAFMFTRRDDLSQLRKVSMETLNAFRPKLQSKLTRALKSENKANKQKQYGKQRIQQAKRRMEEQRSFEKRLDHIIQQQLNHFREERAFVSIDPEEVKKQIKAEEVQRFTATQGEMSPYAKYSTNSFPKKDLKALITKQKSLNPGRDDLGTRLKCSIKDKIQELEARLCTFQPNMLEMMTICSIKQKPQAAFFRKKERYVNPQRSLHYQQVPKDTNNVEQIGQDGHDKVYHSKIYSYLTFLLKVNFSNGLPIRNVALVQRFSHPKAKVFVGEGNNRWLLTALLKRRFWLQVSNRITGQTKFVWSQNSIKEVHNSQKSYNQYLVAQAEKQEKEKEKQKLKNNEQKSLSPSTKPGIRIKINTMKKLSPQTYEQTTLQAYESKKAIKSLTLLQASTIQQQNLIQTETIKPTKSKMRIKDDLRKQQNKKLFLSQSKGEKADGLLQKFKITIKKESEVDWAGTGTITNHVPHNSFIGSKKALFYTMQHYYRNIKKIDPFTVIPRTYHFKSAKDDAYDLFLQNEKQTAQKSIWIVKPGQCTNRGNGISILRAADVTRKLLKKQIHPNGQPKTTIVQSYITDPLLYHGRKFDLRHYMLVTITNGVLKAYWYSQGYVRTSSEPFSLQDLTSPYVHLTNDAIQKNSLNYGKYQAGNKLSYQELQRYLDAAYPKLKTNFKDDVLAKMKEIATDIIKANYRSLDRERRVSNFQIFGLDFMIDRKINPWLIEVNANPCLQISCPLLSRIIPMMVEQSLRLALDPLLPPPSHYPPNQRYYLPQNFLQNLRYELIFDQLEYETGEEQFPQLSYNFSFDEPEDQYEDGGMEIDLAKLVD